MAVPKIGVVITADTAAAEAGIDRVESGVDELGRTTQRTGDRMRGLSGQMRNTSRVSGRMQSSIQNAAFQVGDFATQVSAGTSASRALAMQLPQLLGAFGVLGAVAGAVSAVALPALALAFRDTSEAAKAYKDALDGASEATAEYISQTRQLETGMSSVELGLRDAIAAQAAEVGRLEDEYLAAGLARRVFLEGGLNTERDRLAALQNQLRALVRAREEYERTKANTDAAADAAKEFERAFQSAMQSVQVIANTDIASGVLAASQAAQVLAERLNISLRAALQMQGMIDGNQLSRVNVFDPRDPRYGSQEFATERARRIMASGELFTSSGVSGAGAGGGAGGGKAPEIERAEGIFATLEKMQSDHLGTQLGGWSEYFTSLSSLMGGENDKLLKISKAFAAGEALINAWRAYNQVIADPSVPWWGKLAAGASVLAAGIGAVNAIKQVGSGGSGPRNTSSASGGAAVAASAPLQVSLSGLSPDTIVSGADVGALLDRLSEEAGDRGLQFVGRA